jgi:hypothetical protein
MATDDTWEGWAVYPWDSRGDTRPLAVTRERDDADWFDTGPGSTEVRRVLAILRDPGADDTEAMLAARVKELEEDQEGDELPDCFRPMGVRTQPVHTTLNA